MITVYIAHPLGSGDDRQRNRENASRWCCGLASMFDICPMAQWIVLSGLWSEQYRDLGLRIDFAQIERCDELWLVGGRISPGMGLEMEHAKKCGVTVRDLTEVGYEFPAAGTLPHAQLVRAQSRSPR